MSSTRSHEDILDSPRDTLIESKNPYLRRHSQKLVVKRKPLPDNLNSPTDSGFLPLFQEDRELKSTLAAELMQTDSFSHQTNLENSEYVTEAFHQVNALEIPMRGKMREIGVAFVAVALPITSLTIALVVLVYKNVLPNCQQSSDSTPICKADSCPSGRYVDYPATQLTFIASWISTIASYMSIPIMTLIAFPLARSYIQASSRQNFSELPSPYQLSLLISLIGGGIKSLWTTFNYSVLSRPQNLRVVHTIRISATLLCISLLLSVLSQVVDTWLHEETTSVLYTRYTALQIPPSYGRQLSTACENYYRDYQYSYDGDLSPGVIETGDAFSRVPCGLALPTEILYVENATEAYQLISSPTSTNNISFFSSSLSGLPEQNYAILLPAHPSSEVDWSAKTVGVSTSCIPISEKCNLAQNDQLIDSDGTVNLEPLPTFNCGLDVFNIPVNETFSGFSTDNPDQKPPVLQPYVLYYDVFNLPNSYEIAIAGVVSGSPSPGTPLLNSSGILKTLTGEQTATVIRCTVSAYDLEYESKNGTVHLIEARLADTNTSQTLISPLAILNMKTSGSIPFLITSLTTALFTSSTLDDMLESFANSYSRLSLAFGGPQFEAALGSTASSGHTSIVSCVPLAPLWCLVMLAVVYVILGIFLAIAALKASANINTRSVQAQLSIAGLAAAAFEKRTEEDVLRQASDLFAEYRHSENDSANREAVERVKLILNDSGHWDYHVCESDEKGP